MNLLGRKASGDTVVPATEPRAEKVGGKNAPTPRRNQARARRAKTLKGQPLSAGEKRARVRTAAEQTREALKQTDLAKLPANERVPELVYARDLVDSRFTIATAIIPVAVLYFLGSTLTARAPAAVGFLVVAVPVLLIVAMVLDTVLMSRRLQARVRERFPDSTVPVRMYVGRRAFALRRLRRPVPREVPPTNRWKRP